MATDNSNTREKSGGSSLGNALNKVRSPFRRAVRVRWMMLVGFVVFVALILPKNYVPEFSYELGKPWVAPALKAEFDFPLFKTDSQIAEERKNALAGVPPVFVADTAVPTRVYRDIRTAADQFFAQLESYSLLTTDDPPQAEQMKDDYFLSQFNVDPDYLLSDHPDRNAWEAAFLKRVSGFLNEVYATGYIDTAKGLVRNEVIYVRDSRTRMTQKALTLESDELPAFQAAQLPGLSSEEQQLFTTLVLPRLLPNLSYDEDFTEEERDRVVDKISPVFDKVRRGETIIGTGEAVRPIHDIRIRSYLRARTEQFGSSPFLVTFSGQLVMMTIIVVLLVLFMRNNRTRIYFSDRKLALVLLVFLTMMGIVVLVLKLTLFTQEVSGLNYIFLVPACMVPIILGAFFDERFAYFGNLIIAIFAGAIVPNGFEYLFIQLCAGTATVYSLTRLRNRADFFISLSLILGAYVVSYIGYNFYSKGSFASIEYVNLTLFMLNVVLTFITYPLIYVFERIFGLTSDLTYIELLDTNHPLLKELSVRAPGTFQHSLQVANIAEAVLNRIGGNGLQAKVGALFHDIGKMTSPLHFIENLGDHPNPHNELGYAESAEIIIRHVTDGVRLAQEYGLPAEVVDFIKTHHGTTRTEYFYRKYCEENPGTEVDESLFCYPGPLPFTREMAVLMIADSIEAASRSLKDRSQDRLLALVEGIVDSKVRQRQFNKAYLTFRDLEDAKEVIYNMLVSIYHGRIEYPAAPPESSAVADAENPTAEEE